MTELRDAFHRLLTVRAGHGANSLAPVSTSPDEVIGALAALELEPHDEIITWYSLMGGGTLVDPHDNDGLAAAVDWYRELTAIAEDFADQPEPVSDFVDWFPLGTGGLVVWLREAQGPRPVAHRTHTIDFRRPAFTGGLTSVLDTWADRFTTGRYIVRDDGQPWVSQKFFDEPDELWALHNL